MKKFAKILSVAMLVVMTALVMTACVPSSAEKAVEKLEKAGYETEVYTDADEIGKEMLGFVHEDAVAMLMGGKEDNSIAVVWLDNKDAAKELYDKTYEELKDEIEEGVDVVVKRKGKVVYYGTEQGVKDFE